MRINNVALKITYPQVVIGRLALISNNLTTSFIRFINDSTSPVWLWTCAIGCSNSIPINIQCSWITWDIN